MSIGIRNAKKERFRLAYTVGLRVVVCHDLAFRGDYTPVFAKHSKHFHSKTRSQSEWTGCNRNFDLMRRRVEGWGVQQLSGEAELTIYRAFIEGDLEVPKHLARRVHALYFNPQPEESHHGRCGAFQTHLLRPSRNWIRFRNSRLQRNWGSVWKLGSRGRSSEAWRQQPSRCFAVV